MGQIFMYKIIEENNLQCIFPYVEVVYIWFLWCPAAVVNDNFQI